MLPPLPSQGPCKVAHLTSAHPRDDTRIFYKECHSLSQAGYDVYLIVADGRGDTLGDIPVLDVGKPRGRLDRMHYTTLRVYSRAVAIDADIYHLHDPELIPIGLKLLRQGKQVIFDAHEDLPKQQLSKPYFCKSLNRLLSRIIEWYERKVCPRFSAIVAATPSIASKFQVINPRSIDINNYPILGELNSEISWSQKHRELCYIGGLSSIRGIRQLIQAMEHIESDGLLNLAGEFSEPSLEAEVKHMSGWKKVHEWGFLDRAGVKQVLERSMAGLVTLLPISNYLEALPVKMFEYMAVGLPVIASHFPLWRKIVEESNSGICVDPENPEAIAQAMDWMFQNPEKANTMGLNGKKAVETVYNWSNEERKLLQLYGELRS